MFASIDENKKVCGICSIDVSGTEIELTAEIDISETDEEATFFENGKFVRKNIFDIDKYKSKTKSKIFQQCKEEMETKNVGINSINIEAKIDCREIDILRVDQLIGLSEAKGATDTTLIDYILYDNTTKKVSLAKVKAAKNEMIENIMNMLYYKHSLYSLLDIAVTKEEIDKIAWDYIPNTNN